MENGGNYRIFLRRLLGVYSDSLWKAPTRADTKSQRKYSVKYTITDTHWSYLWMKFPVIEGQVFHIFCTYVFPWHVVFTGEVPYWLLKPGNASSEAAKESYPQTTNFSPVNYWQCCGGFLWLHSQHPPLHRYMHKSNQMEQKEASSERIHSGLFLNKNVWLLCN